MPLLTAYEDFAARTLSAFKDALQKLRFIASLRDQNGEYAHWGMHRTFGRDKANEAIDRTHRELTLKVLETPIPLLHSSEGARALSVEESSASLGPSEWDGGAKEHLDYVLNVLTLLDRTSATTSHPAA